MSLLSLVQKFTRRTALPVPTTVVGNNDPQVAQILTTLEEECIELAARHQWKSLINECTFLALATESQGTLASLGSGPTTTNGLRYILNGVMWNRSLKIPIYGPLDPQKWQEIKANTSLSFGQYRIRGVTTGTQATLIITPVPTAGHTIAFEYVTDNWCLNGTTPSAVFVADTDTVLLAESLVNAGLKWRWKKEKGLAYGEDFNSYERMVTNAIGRDGTKASINLQGTDDEVRPAINVPPGSWPLP